MEQVRMMFDDYRLTRLSDVYLEDIPRILHPYWAERQFRGLSESKKRDYSRLYRIHSMGFCSNVESDIRLGNAVFVRNFRNVEIFSVCDSNGHLKNDLPLFLRSHLERVIAGNKTKPWFGSAGSVSSSIVESEAKPNPPDDGLTKYQRQVQQNHKNSDRVMETLRNERRLKASYGNDPDFIKGYVEASKNRDLEPLLSLTPAASVVDTVKAAKDFITNPSLESAAMAAVAAIPGRVADRVVENIPIKDVRNAIQKPDKNKKAKIKKRVVQETAGVKGSWNKKLNNPDPDTIYEVTSLHDGEKVMYSYETDHLGRTVRVKGKLKLSPKDTKRRNKENRSKHYQSKFGGKIAKKEGKTGSYQGGHSVGSVFMGPAEKINIVPQLASQNIGGGDWHEMEGKWRNHLQDGKSVDVDINFAYDGTSEVPSKIFGNYKVNNGKPKKFKYDN